MHRLPNEVLSNVFSRLHFRDKEECMLVCHLWSNIISSMILFETLPISGGYIFRKYQRYLDSQPAAKAQVKSLIINPVVSNRYISGSFQECFPKLQSLHVQTCSHQPLIDDNHDQANQIQMDFIIPVSKIEILEQYGCSAPSQCFLSLGVYKSLKKLVINKNGDDRAMDFDLLINAPNLISLTLGNVEISTNNLETIHSNLRFLKSLELNSIILVPQNDATNATVDFPTPPEYLTTLLITTRHFNATNDTGEILECLRYIQHNYANLLNFRFIIDSTAFVIVGAEEEIINNGILPLLPHLNRGLNLLEINCSTLLPSLFEKMDELGFKPRCLNLMVPFSTSRYGHISSLGNYNFIQKLTLNINTAKWIPYLLINLGSFKTLHIKGTHSFMYTPQREQCSVQLVEILTLCLDKLDSLIIEMFYVDSSIQIWPLFSLTKLEIYVKQISISAYKFISRSLPLLSHLKLAYHWVVNKNVPLENLNLKRLDLIVPRNTHIVIKTVNDGNEHHFRPNIGVANKSDPTHSLYLLRKMTPEEIDSCEGGSMVFELNSVQELFINNMFTRR